MGTYAAAYACEADDENVGSATAIIPVERRPCVKASAICSRLSWLGLGVSRAHYPSANARHAPRMHLDLLHRYARLRVDVQHAQEDVYGSARAPIYIFELTLRLSSYSCPRVVL